MSNNLQINQAKDINHNISYNNNNSHKKPNNNHNHNPSKIPTYYELTTIRGNIVSDVFLKRKNKERLEFRIIVKKSNSQPNQENYNQSNQSNYANHSKFFQVVVFNQDLLQHIKEASKYNRYRKGVNISIQGEVVAEIQNNRPMIKIIATRIKTNITNQ